MPVQDILIRIVDELRGAWRFRRWAIGTAWGVCLVGWAIVFSIPDTYQASARVYVDSRSILRPLLEGLAIDPDVASGLDLVRQVMLSRPNLEKVARETDLDVAARTPERREALLASLQERLTIDAGDLRARTAQGEGLYVITFTDSRRDKSVEVVDVLLKSFVESALGEKRTGQETAQRFIDEQIAEYEQRLAAAESRLADFKRDNVGLMPDSRGDYFGRLQQESAELERLRTSLAIAESRRAEIRRQLDGEEPYLFGFDSPAAASPVEGAAGDLTYRIQALEKQLEELLLRYTEKHPEVIATRATIEELRRRQQEELERVRAGQRATGSLASSLKTNPVYQSLEMELNRAEVQVAELRQEIAERQGRVGTLRRQVNLVPEVEAELARLNRDYEVTRQKYLELVERRETASLTEQADRTGTVKFEIIEPPAAPLDPVAPNRPLLLAGVLFAGLAVGGALAWGLSLLRPVFHSVSALTALTGLPVLAAISRTWEERHRQLRRTELLRVAAAMALLLVVFGLTLALQLLGLRPLQQLFG